MNRLYLVSYDICEPRRPRTMDRLMRGDGQHTQLSVFLCDLSPRRRLALDICLGQLIKPPDQVLVIDLGPASDATWRRITTLGVPFQPRRRGAIVVQVLGERAR